MSGARNDRSPRTPEQEHAEEALLWSAWADSPADEAELPELPEDVLGLLDGSLRGEEAARVRRRLAEDPGLARSAGRFVASLRDLPVDTLGREAPGRLLAEAAELVPPGAAPRPRPGSLFLSRAARWLSGGGAPALGAVVAAALLVVFVARERSPSVPEDPALRAAPGPTPSIAIESPEPDARRRGGLELAWQAVPGAVRYRVVLVALRDGDVIEAGRTEDTRLDVDAAFLAERLGEEEPADLHWIVRARLIDGTEVSSEPRRLTWSAR